jgi:hemerythrin-like domain-containing protein
MTSSLFDTAPDFDQPVAVLKHCHDRIRKQLKTMELLASPAALAATPDEVRQAAGAVLRYFEKAAPHHHEDEEHDLLPMLTDTARDDDAALLAGLMPEVLAEHRQMEQLWERLQPQLAAIAAGQSATLDSADATRFGELYLRHMDKEESHIAPMAKRLFSAEQMQRLGNAMRTRRGIALPGES